MGYPEQPQRCDANDVGAKPIQAAVAVGLSGGVVYGAPLISPGGLEVSAGPMALLSCLPSELLSGVVEGFLARSRVCQIGTLLRSHRESLFVLSEI
jgi:hypothetical protein